MPELDFTPVVQAIELIASGAKRVDGQGFKVYVIPSGVIRIDIDPPQKEEA